MQPFRKTCGLGSTQRPAFGLRMSLPRPCLPDSLTACKSVQTSRDLNMPAAPPKGGITALPGLSFPVCHAQRRPRSVPLPICDEPVRPAVDLRRPGVGFERLTQRVRAQRICPKTIFNKNRRMSGRKPKVRPLLYQLYRPTIASCIAASLTRHADCLFFEEQLRCSASPGYCAGRAEVWILSCFYYYHLALIPGKQSGNRQYTWLSVQGDRRAGSLSRAQALVSLDTVPWRPMPVRMCHPHACIKLRSSSHVYHIQTHGPCVLSHEL